MSIDRLLKAYESYTSGSMSKKILEVYAFAEEAHHGVFRKSGEPYIHHPLRVANELISLKADEETICAALLHDVPEDTKYSLEDVRSRFGSKIAELVDGVTKISKLQYDGDLQRRQIDSLQKMFLLMADDVRIILIKLADRLDNVRTIDALPEEKRKRIAGETLEVYVPLANLFGMWNYKKELEDNSFRVLFPSNYQQLSLHYGKEIAPYQDYIREMSDKLTKAAKDVGISCTIEGRYKSINSIFLKMRDKDRKFHEMYDVFALIITVENKADCYELMGLIHRLWKPARGRFKDYIAVPKTNGYRSVHTTVFGPQGRMTEFQIRTEAMDVVNRYGIAAHTFQGAALDHAPFRYQEWMDNLLDLQKSQPDCEQFMHDLKMDIFQDRIFVYTPKGDLIDLPQGATPLDFAYSVHTNLGHRCERVKINNHDVSISTPLNTGDVVEIIGAEEPKGPDIRWLNFVKTNIARRRIQEWLKRESDEKKVLLAESQLRKEFRRAGYSYRLSKRRRQKLFKDFQKASYRELLLAIAEGDIAARDVVAKAYMHDLRLPDNRDLITKFFDFIQFTRGVKSKVRKYRVGIVVTSLDRAGGLIHLLQPFEKRNINMQEVTSIGWGQKYFRCYFYFDIDNVNDFTDICEELEAVDGVKKIETIAPWRKYLFYVTGIVTLFFWVMHPFAVRYLLNDLGYQGTIFSNMLYLGIIPLFLSLYLFRETIKRGFPDIHQSFGYWFIAFFINTVALGAVIYETFAFNVSINIFLLIASIMLVYGILIMDVMTSIKSS